MEILASSSSASTCFGERGLVNDGVSTIDKIIEAVLSANSRRMSKVRERCKRSCLKLWMIVIAPQD